MRTIERCVCSRQNGGVMSDLDQSHFRNHLLSHLAPEDFRQLAAHLRPVPLEPKQVLQEADQPIETVYFLEAGMVSMLATLLDGEFVEVGIIGREGMVGIATVLGDA